MFFVFLFIYLLKLSIFWRKKKLFEESFSLKDVLEAGHTLSILLFCGRTDGVTDP